MKEPAVDCQRAVVAHSESPEVTQPGDGALDDPVALVTPQSATILRWELASSFPMPSNQLDATPTELLAQSIAVVTAVGDHVFGFLSWPHSAMVIH